LRRSALSPPRRPLLSRFQDTIASQLLSRINKTQGFSSPRKFSQVSPSPVSKWGDCRFLKSLLRLLRNGEIDVRFISVCSLPDIISGRSCYTYT
jgi:hypothetical protein